MNEAQPLTPPPAIARAAPVGRFSFGFGPRFFVALLVGLVWLGPAWWFRQCIAAMLLWDVLAVGLWIWDLRRLPRPNQLEVRRIWSARPALGVPAEVSIELRNILHNDRGGKSRQMIRASIVDEAPIALRLDPPAIELSVRGNAAASARYAILPAERGDAHLGRTYAHYQSGLRFAERWAVANTAQTVCVLPNIEQAKRHTLLLIRSRQVEMEKRRRRQRLLCGPVVYGPAQRLQTAGSRHRAQRRLVVPPPEFLFIWQPYWDWWRRRHGGGRGSGLLCPGERLFALHWLSHGWMFRRTVRTSRQRGLVPLFHRTAAASCAALPLLRHHFGL